MKRMKFKINGMHCTACAMSIDGELEDTRGVQEANTNYVKQQTEVVYDEQQVDIDALIAAIKNAGYTAQPY